MSSWFSLLGSFSTYNSLIETFLHKLRSFSTKILYNVISLHLHVGWTWDQCSKTTEEKGVPWRRLVDN